MMDNKFGPCKKCHWAPTPAAGPNGLCKSCNKADSFWSGVTFFGFFAWLILGISIAVAFEPVEFVPPHLSERVTPPEGETP